MIVELGNHSAINGLDEAPKVTYVHVPEADETGAGGYTHKVGGISVDDFRLHRQEATDYKNGVTNLPDHELLLAVVNAWPAHATAKPEWVNVVSHDLTPDGVADDVAKFLGEHYQCPVGRPGDLEDRYWTKVGPPGEGDLLLPPITNLFTNDGRAQQAINYGGGQTGLTGAATATTATTLTTGLTLVTNAWTGYRIYAQSSTTNMVWGNVVSNNNTASASVVTVDRWYSATTPGGAAGTTPSSTTPYILADGGSVSAWFVGLTVTNITPAATDHTMSGEYIVGTPAGVTSSAGYLRKIAPYALTSGTSPLTLTLTPVFTGVAGQDIFPQTFFAIGVFTSMVSTFGGAGGPMKFETSLNASATVAAAGDQITVTETITGS